jgi:septal ring factor EnvC (AmiA/AmiB activator)
MTSLVSILFAVIDLEKTVIPVLIALISSGFVFGLVKVLPERKSILVQASENAVRVVNDAISTLQTELKEARAEILKLEAELKVAQQNRQVIEAQMENLRMKVAKLEAEVDIYNRLTNRHDHVEVEREHEHRLTKLEEKEENA